MRRRYRWRILAYCLMGNHYHLLTQTLDGRLAVGMRQLNGVYAQWFNRRHRRVGHLFQGRYLAKLVQADEHVLQSARYIVRNPVAAGLCACPSEWPWSSHRETLGLAPPSFCDPAFLLAFYAPTRERARALYREHAEEQPDPPSAGHHPLIVGDDDFVGALLERIEPAPGIPERYRRRPRPPLEALLGASDDVVAIARAHEHGYTLREIARALGVNASTVSRRLRRHSAARSAPERGRDRATPRT